MIRFKQSKIGSSPRPGSPALGQLQDDSLGTTDELMPRDGSLILPDVSAPMLSLVCEPSGRHRRYNMERLRTEHGEAKLTDLCRRWPTARRRARSASTTGARRLLDHSRSPKSALNPIRALLRIPVPQIITRGLRCTVGEVDPRLQAA
jgi:hypothetical protein